MIKKILKFKAEFALIILTAFCITTMGAVVSENDASAFMTKAEFDLLKNNFQSQIDQYNSNVDSKIDEAIASYLAGINYEKRYYLDITDNINEICFYRYPSFRTIVTDENGHYGSRGSQKLGNYITGISDSMYFGSPYTSRYGLLPFEAYSRGSSTSYTIYWTTTGQERNYWNNRSCANFFLEAKVFLSFNRSSNIPGTGNYANGGYYYSSAHAITALDTSVNGIQNVITDAAWKMYFSMNIPIIADRLEYDGFVRSIISVSFQFRGNDVANDFLWNTWTSITYSTRTDSEGGSFSYSIDSERRWNRHGSKGNLLQPYMTFFSNGTNVNYLSVDINKLFIDKLGTAGTDWVKIQTVSRSCIPQFFRWGYFDSAIFVDSQSGRLLHTVSAGGKSTFDWFHANDTDSDPYRFSVANECVEATFISTGITGTMEQTSYWSGGYSISSTYQFRRYGDITMPTTAVVEQLAGSWVYPVYKNIAQMKYFNNYRMALAGKRVGLTDGVPLFTATSKGICHLKMEVEFTKCLFEYNKSRVSSQPDFPTNSTSKARWLGTHLRTYLTHGPDPDNRTKDIKMTLSLDRMTDSLGTATTLHYYDAAKNDKGVTSNLLPNVNNNTYDIYLQLEAGDTVWCKLFIPTDETGPFDAARIVDCSAEMIVED